MPELIGGATELGWVCIKAVSLVIVAAICLRLERRRVLAQLGVVDFAAATAIGAVIGRTATSRSTSLLTGAVAIISIVAVHHGMTFLLRFSRFAHKAVRTPRLLIVHGHVCRKELRKAGLSLEELESLLRENHAEEIPQIEYALFEPSGALVVHPTGRPPGPLMRKAISEAETRGSAPPRGE